MGREQFNYDVLKAAYDQDPVLQQIIKNFNQDQIELKSDETDDLPDTNAEPGGKLDPKADLGNDRLDKMAKSGLDSDKL